MEHYFTENPKSQFLKEKFDVEILGENIVINSGSGLFSLKDLDFGTKLLIENCEIPKRESNQANKPVEVLDLGCGYGIVGIVVKKKNPDCEITMSDINERAIRMSKQNCEENHVECKIFKSDVFSHNELKEKMFDVILTNPPFSAGKSKCIQMIKESFDHLNSEGSLQLVAPHNKGGESLKKIMQEVFDNVGELEKKRGYRVYISVKR